MAEHLVLADYRGLVSPPLHFKAGTVLDDLTHNVAALKGGGMASIVFNPGTMQATLDIFAAYQGSHTEAGGELLVALLAAEGLLP